MELTENEIELIESLLGQSADSAQRIDCRNPIKDWQI
jgi:hypothetical protein